MRAAFLGPAGTFSHEALQSDPAASGWDAVPMATVFDAVNAVADGDVDRALVPIENSHEGAVGPTLDALAVETEGVVIVGEVVQPVRHCLVARSPVALSDVRLVVSHPQANAQCARFLRDEMPGATVLPVTSTAEAVRMVAEGRVPQEPAAALGTPLAARLYGGSVLREGVEDADDNATRFVWVAREGVAATPAGPSKTSVVWWGGGDESPGWLVRCLSEFAFRGVNLTRIESRPRRLGLGHYMFFVDLDGGLSDPPVAEAVAALREQAETVKVLGSYPAATPSGA